MKNHEQGIFLALSWVRTNRYDQRVLCNKMDRTKSPTLFELMFFISTSFGQRWVRHTGMTQAWLRTQTMLRTTYLHGGPHQRLSVSLFTSR